MTGRHSSRRGGQRKAKPKRTTKTFKTRFTVNVSYGELAPADLARPGPVILHAQMVTRSALKVAEARYFLAMLRAHLHNETAILYHLSALLSSMRSITFVLQKEGRANPAFDAWYKAKQKEMVDLGMRAFVDLRNEAEKEGLEAPTVQIVIEVREHADGRTEQNLRFERFTIRGKWVDEPLEQLSAAVAYLASLVAEAGRLGLIAAPENIRSITTKTRHLKEQPDGSWVELPIAKSSLKAAFTPIDGNDQP